MLKIKTVKLITSTKGNKNLKYYVQGVTFHETKGGSKVVRNFEISNFSGTDLLKVAKWLKNERQSLNIGNPCLNEIEILKKCNFLQKMSVSFIKCH